MSDSPFAADDNPYQAPSLPSISTDLGGADSELGRAADMLRQTKPWVRLISVMCFICAVFVALAGVVLLVVRPRGMPGGIGAGIGLVYIVMATLYIAPGVFLWTYATRIGMFMRHTTPYTLASALESQKSFWKFVGIVTLIVLVVYLLIIVFAMVFGAMGGFR